MRIKLKPWKIKQVNKWPMNIKYYKYMEHYRGNKIFIYGLGREWRWGVIVNDKAKNSPASYFSVQSALSKARKFIDNEII